MKRWVLSTLLAVLLVGSVQLEARKLDGHKMYGPGGDSSGGADTTVVAETREGSTTENMMPTLPTIFRQMSQEPMSNATCPAITLSETSLMMRLDRLPGRWYWGVRIKTECANGNGEDFDPVYTSLDDSRIVSYNNRRYIRVAPNTVVGSLSCGETIRCRHSLVYTTTMGDVEYGLSNGESCDYDYRNFIQWGYRETGVGYTCSEGALLYTLLCVECQFADFDWDLAYNMSGDPLERGGSSSARAFNYVMVITAVSVVGFAVVLAFVALVVRGRRRASIDRDVAAMVARREEEARAQNKPPELFEVGDDDEGGSHVELMEIGKEYMGPIVVKYDTLVDGDEDREQGSCASSKRLDDDSRPLSKHASRRSAATDWTLTQIAVLDPDVEPEEDEADEEILRKGEGSLALREDDAIVEDTKEDDGEDSDAHYSDAADVTPAGSSSS